MLDAAQPLLLHEVIQDAPLGVHVHLDRVFIDIVEEIEVEIVHAAPFQLLLEDGGGVVALGDLMAGVFVRKIPAPPGVAGQGAAQHPLRQSAVIGVGGVEVVDAVGHGVVHHGVHLRLIDGGGLLAPGEQGQAHGAKAQAGQGQALEIVGQHIASSSKCGGTIIFYPERDIKCLGPKEGGSPDESIHIPEISS